MVSDSNFGGRWGRAAGRAVRGVGGWLRPKPAFPQLLQSHVEAFGKECILVTAA